MDDDRRRICIIEGSSRGADMARLVAMTLSQSCMFSPVIEHRDIFAGATAPPSPDPFDMPWLIGRDHSEPGPWDWNDSAHLRTPARDIEHYETPKPLSKRARRRLKGRKP